MISFTNTPYIVNGHVILRLPHEQSALLTSRSQIMATGVIGGDAFTGPVEPDGHGGHWIDVTNLSQVEGTTLPVAVEIEQTNEGYAATVLFQSCRLHCRGCRKKCSAYRAKARVIQY